MRRFTTWVASAVCLVFLAGGCVEPYTGPYVPPDTPTKGTGPDPTDIRSVVQRMTRSLLGISELAGAEGRPRIALLPVKNRTRFRIDGELFTTKIQDMMMALQPGKFGFVARDRIHAIENERRRKRSGETDSSKLVSLAGVDFFLTGELRGMHQVSWLGQSDYVNFHFELIDAETGIKVWAESYDIRKIGKWSDVYR